MKENEGQRLGKAIGEMLGKVSDDFLEIKIKAERGMNGYWRFKVKAKPVKSEPPIVLSHGGFFTESHSDA